MSGGITLHRLRWWLRRPGASLQRALLALGHRLKLTRAMALPLEIDVEPINRCNFRCDHCQVTHWDKAVDRLTLQQFERILEAFPRLSWLKLQGMGEPFINRETIDMLASASQRHIPTSFVSNGSIMPESLRSRLSTLRGTKMMFSVDGATKDTFEAMRPGSNFQDVTANIRRLSDSQTDSRVPPMAFWTVVTETNVHELADIVRLTSSLRVPELFFQIQVADWGKPAMAARTRPLRVTSTATLDDQLDKAARLAASLGVVLNIYRDNMLKTGEACSWPWRSTYIASNGDVVPCCVVADSSTMKLGNIFQTSFQEIWNGKAYRALREQMRSGNIPDYCKGCYGQRAIAPDALLAASSLVRLRAASPLTLQAPRAPLAPP